MSENVKKQFGPEDLVDMADREGVAVATVRDGYVLVFTKKQLELLLEQVNQRGADRCTLFVQQRKFEN